MNQNTKTSSGVAQVRTADEQESFNLFGIQVNPIVTAEDSGGLYTLLDLTLAPQAGTPPHISYREEKMLYVLEGEFAILLGNETVNVTKGAVISIPKDMPHSFANAGSEPARLLLALSPGGHETYLWKLYQAVQAGTLEQDMASISSEYQIEILASGG